ncbi:hypothetical protein HSEST_1484 [Halapricum desulfuricans]|uniref:Uncharacterized protein n=1 Tax=Halapricum desulfuricans TaxID=2841257 RepID=A0A897NW89_9EURY|nr:hypothetical protein HSEST_1484 [Halapricum desulfuricans]
MQDDGEGRHPDDPDHGEHASDGELRWSGTVKYPAHGGAGLRRLGPHCTSRRI